MADFVMSLQSGKLGKLPIEGNLASTNENFRIDAEKGYVSTDEQNGKAIVSQLVPFGKTAAVTSVPWRTNHLTLQEVDKFPNYFLSYIEGVIYATSGNVLYRSVDGLKTVEEVSVLPFIPDNNPILVTPAGYFCKGENKIYRSFDLESWTLEYEVNHLGLYHMFDFHEDGGTVYIYTGEYHTLNTERCKVYRGVYNEQGTGEWEMILDFRSRTENLENPTDSELFARHVHVVVVDPYTGHLYVNTGDSNAESKMMISEDNGDNFRKLGEGSQDWRCLSVWFTEKFIYWNMDTTNPQSIWRLSRENLPNQSVDNDLKEHVALLDNGSHWYHCKAKDDQGNDIIVMSASAEGQLRDWNARLFGIRENVDETVTVDELLVMQSKNPDVYISHFQIEPKFQDNSGFIYCRGREAEHNGILKFRFVRESEVTRAEWVEPNNFL